MRFERGEPSSASLDLPKVNAPLAIEGAEGPAELLDIVELSGCFDEDEESEALRQTRNNAEVAASADSVRAYLEQIGEVALLNAEQEVKLAERIEVQAMADIASIGLIQERAARQQDIVVDQLQTALDSRVIIEQAKGVIAERHGIDPGEAFTLLRGYARKHNQRLTELAAAVIDGSTTATELLPTPPAPTPRK